MLKRITLRLCDQRLRRRSAVLFLSLLGLCAIGTPPAVDAQLTQDHPTKVPKPKTRLNLLRQMQIDLDMAAGRARVDDKDRKKLDKCHEVLIDAIAQQQRYKSVNAGKVNGCLKDLDKFLDADIFADADRDKLRQDRDKLGESVGSSRRLHLPKPI